MEQGKMRAQQPAVRPAAAAWRSVVGIVPRPGRARAQDASRVQLDLRAAPVMGDAFRMRSDAEQPALQRLQVHPRRAAASRLSVRADGRAASTRKYKFVVADTGIGMSEGVPCRTCSSRTPRDCASAQRQAVGTGLGMPITQSLVTQMNGEIHVESAAGQGQRPSPSSCPLPSRPTSRPQAARHRQTAGTRPSPLERPAHPAGRGQRGQHGDHHRAARR